MKIESDRSSETTLKCGFRLSEGKWLTTSTNSSLLRFCHDNQKQCLLFSAQPKIGKSVVLLSASRIAVFRFSARVRLATWSDNSNGSAVHAPLPTPTRPPDLAYEPRMGEFGVPSPSGTASNQLLGAGCTLGLNISWAVSAARTWEQKFLSSSIFASHPASTRPCILGAPGMKLQWSTQAAFVILSHVLFLAQL